MKENLTEPGVSATVIVHCGDLDVIRVDRRLRQVLATVPTRAKVIATTMGPVHLHGVAARRARSVVINDGGLQLINDAVAGAQDVIVVPFSASVSGSWFEVTSRRLREQEDAIGVLACGFEHLFAYPGKVKALDAPRTCWDNIEGVSARVRGGGSLSSPRRTLSAVLIVKDEEKNIERCLRSLTGVVDEIVVYDTGSRDATPRIASALGALFVEGYWDDDFAAARNRALGHATGDWVISVDADEVLDCDRDALRAWVDETDGSLSLVRIISSIWSGSSEGNESRGTRIFQRDGHVWEGALHEQVVAAPGSPEVRVTATLPPLRLLHSGYSNEALVEKDKVNRNVSIINAVRDRLTHGTTAWAEATIDLARTLSRSEDHEKCLEEFDRTIDIPVPPYSRSQAGRVVVPLLLSRNELERADAWVSLVEGAEEAPGRIRLWRAWIAALSGDLVRARELVFDYQDYGWGGTDFWGRTFDLREVEAFLVELDLAENLTDSAMTRMRSQLQESPQTVNIPLLFRVSAVCGHSMVDLAREAPADFIDRSLREMIDQHPEAALPWFAALHCAYPDDLRYVGAGASLAALSGIEAALTWSLAAREAGLAEICPLSDMAKDERFPDEARLVALVTLAHGLLEPWAQEALRQKLPLASPESRSIALDSARVIFPGLAKLESVLETT